jgi:glycosyltransferase involved in cell wall biosynthesis
MMSSMQISAVIITSNEERRIEGALKSLAGIASEIVVVDCRSGDETVKIVRRYTDRVFERDWTNFADQKNYANAQASHPWILSLDADERVSPELRQELLDLKKTEPDVDVFSIPRKVYYLGRWIRHSGWYPDRKLRLFRKGKARWEGDYVHEKLAVTGRIGKLFIILLTGTFMNIWPGSTASPTWAPRSCMPRKRRPVGTTCSFCPFSGSSAPISGSADFWMGLPAWSSPSSPATPSLSATPS